MVMPGKLYFQRIMADRNQNAKCQNNQHFPNDVRHFAVKVAEVRKAAVGTSERKAENKK